ncbi:prolipoprotein diacylglyceryl transferase family protein [Olivibacter sp. XZL3]|uniref:prolipoprotein diacylglyceryl transferase family protein n=1 Tax=Olivibacter sp. XZL3 TaxID=1735116 RepID=UPI001065E3F6|nr:prolipoprotein diacylglyceryl transferase family protein [Olivibacter sp. XZL3]
MRLTFINWDISPEIFQLFGFPIRYYGLLFGAGLLLCILLLKGVFRRENLSEAAYENLFIYGFIGIFAGARLGHCLFYDFSYYSQHPLEIILPIQQDAQGHYHVVGFLGLASHGGTIGLIIALLLYSKKISKKQK